MDHVMKLGFTLVILVIVSSFTESWGVFLGGLTVMIALIALYQNEFNRK
ncbi:hypothetical protein [Bacillus sp. FJAT-29937]|nr:hypothetical protein [Bacillus sp. FJAT-29937]